MNSQEITINNISSTDLIHALTFMVNRNEIIALLFDLMDDYKDSPTNELMRRWFAQDIELTELITEIFTFLQPNIPIAPSADMIDFSEVDYVKVSGRSSNIQIHFVSSRVQNIPSYDQRHHAFFSLISDEIQERGLHGISESGSSWSSNDTFYFQVDTESKLSAAQTRAIRMLLKAKSEYELKLANAEEGERVYLRGYYSNNQLNHKVKDALAKRGLITTGKRDRFYGSDVYLSDAGLELAKKIAPESTVEGIKKERKSELEKARELASITEAMKAHYAEQIKTPVPDSMTLDISVNPYMDNGVDGKAFTLTHSYKAEQYGSIKQFDIKATVSKGRDIQILAQKGYGGGVGKYSSSASIEIPSDKMAIFVDILQTAQSLLTELNVSPIKPYTGKVYSED